MLTLNQKAVNGVAKKCSMMFIVLFSLLSLQGCYTPHKPAEIADNKKIYEQDPLPYYDNSYLISPGDVIEVTYHVDVDQKDRYIIEIGDQVRLEFYYYPQMDRTLNVRPDGRITIPYKGDVMAAGLTPAELSAEINTRYVDLLKDPVSTISLIRYGAKIRELKEAIKTSARGQSRLALVQPDGKVKVPLLDGMLVAGKTIDQVAKSINDAYDSIIPGMFTSSTIYEANGNQVYIFGAVRAPGYYKLQGPTTLLQAIGMAGGFDSYGQTDSTLLISRDEFNRPVGRLVDLANVLSTGNIGKDLFVKQSDVIFVPTTLLGRATLIGSSIRSMIPVNLSFSYAANDNIDLLKPNQ